MSLISGVMIIRMFSCRRNIAWLVGVTIPRRCERRLSLLRVMRGYIGNE